MQRGVTIRLSGPADDNAVCAHLPQPLKWATSFAAFHGSRGAISPHRHRPKTGACSSRFWRSVPPPIHVRCLCRDKSRSNAGWSCRSSRCRCACLPPKCAANPVLQRDRRRRCLRPPLAPPSAHWLHNAHGYIRSHPRLCIMSQAAPGFPALAHGWRQI